LGRNKPTKPWDHSIVSMVYLRGESVVWGASIGDPVTQTAGKKSCSEQQGPRRKWGEKKVSTLRFRREKGT